jgi:carboxypeptidase C (cathepsin A)
MMVMRILAAAILSATPGIAHAASQQCPAAAPAPLVSTTHHSAIIGGQAIAYDATVAEHYVKDDKGAPEATIDTIDYVRSGTSDPAKRPIIFAFNGGPGAASSPLHMSALGPVRRIEPAPSDPSAPQWQDNPYSLLDTADLVFIDPVGTGFARPFACADVKNFYDSNKDAAEVKAVIQEWLAAHHRESSPRYLAGESYGTMRASLILRDSKDLPFDGVMLIALVGEAPGNEMPYVTSLPTMAAGAWFHNKIDRAGRSVEDIYKQAVEFARTEYITALIQGASLPEAKRHEIAQKMSALIGLPADLIEKNDLRISKNVYMFNLLKDANLRTGLLDVRVTAPLAPGQIGDIDDPALGVVPTKKDGTPVSKGPINPAAIGPVPSPVVGAYLTQALKFLSQDKYYGINFSANAVWNYDGLKNTIKFAGDAMTANPHMRMFWATGYYDLTTPSYEARYTLDQDGIPADRLTAAYFAGPHGVYAGDANLAAFATAVRAFVTTPSP